MRAWLSGQLRVEREGLLVQAEAAAAAATTVFV